MNQPSDRSSIAATADPLPSWNDGRARQSIVDFVAMVTKPGSVHFVPMAERIALFDNDDSASHQPLHGYLRRASLADETTPLEELIDEYLAP